MGQGGYLMLKNSTPYRWVKTDHHSYQMKSWDSKFPGIIEPGTSASIYIEWTEGTKNKKDDSGEIDYTLQGTNNKFQIQARAKNGFEIKAAFLHIPGLGGEVSLGWNHNGAIYFTLIGQNPKFSFIASNQSHPNWMEFLPDSCSIASLTVPGTHDSCTFGINEGLIKGLPNEVLAMFHTVTALAVPIILGLTKCQDLTIRQQLDLGIRFLDIRIQKSGNKLEAYHGGIRLHMNFSEILTECYRFLDLNKKETILLSVQNEGSGKNPIKDLVEAEIKKNIKYWATQEKGTETIPRTTIPSLGQVRGKLLLIRRYSSDEDYGINASSWPDNSDYFERKINNIDEKIEVQDAYKVATLFNIHTKWEKVEKHFQRSTTHPDHKSLFLNFASGSSTGAYPYTVAYQGDGVTIKGVNSRMLEYLKNNYYKQKLGVIPLDFPEKTTNLVTALINCNPF